MNDLEERNVVWELVECIIEKHGLKISSEFLDPQTEHEIIFGDFVQGHPMSFEGDFEQTVHEIKDKLPSEYDIARAYVLDTGSAVIGVTKTV